MHGIMMWMSWTLFGLVQIVTNRYFVHRYAWRQSIHTLSGFILMSTVGSGVFLVWEYDMGKFSFHNLHEYTGWSVIGLAVLVTLGGLFAEMTRRSATMEWKTAMILY